MDAKTGAYDEAKVMLGYDSPADARAAHEAAFSDGKGAARLGGIKKMPIPQMKEWLTSDATKKPVSPQAKRRTKAGAAEEVLPAAQRRPFIKYVGDRFGGINPTGKVAAELRHRGVNVRTAPGLFRRSGHKDLDNLDASEHPDLAGAIEVDTATGYLAPQSIIDAIVEEVAGTPLAFGRHVVDQQQARDHEQSRRDQQPGNGEAAIRAGTAQGIPERDRDIRTDEERRSDISRAVDDEITQLGLDDILTPAERSAIVDEVDRGSGDAWDVIHDFIVRSQPDVIPESASYASAGGEGDGIPFGDDVEGSREGGSRTQGEGADSVVKSDRDHARPAKGPSLTTEPAIEAGADGLPQIILPGMEGSSEQAQPAKAAHQRAEVEARQNQSRQRRLDGNSGDAGPLFDDQQDMFGAS